MSERLQTFLKTHQPKNGKFFLIAIDGRGGSGKSTLAEYLKSLLPDFTFTNGDDYFEPVEAQIVWGEFNDKRFIDDVIAPLKQASTTIAYRPYNWHAEPHITEQTIKIDKGICIERCFVLPLT